MFFQILFRVFKGMLEMDGVIVDKLPPQQQDNPSRCDSACQAKVKP
ncbi:hypothetical protein [Rheinheimera sp.]|nr:hypothetical protein [Rheinheimera sp.]